MAKVPVMTDQTGQQICRSLNRGNAILEEFLGDIGAQLGGIPSVFVAEVTVNHDDNGAYKSLTLASEFADMKAACLAGKVVVLHVHDATNQISFFSALSKVSGFDGPAEQMIFDCLSSNNPTGRPGSYVLMHVAATGTVIVNVQPLSYSAQHVACDVTVGGTKYNNVADALAALAAKL